MIIQADQRYEFISRQLSDPKTHKAPSHCDIAKSYHSKHIADRTGGNDPERLPRFHLFARRVRIRAGL
jgi:hypothetical protein